MFARSLVLATWFALNTLVASSVAACSRSSSSNHPSHKVWFRARVLDRETLRPLSGVSVQRFDGKVTLETGTDGTFAFPMDEGDFRWACEVSNPGPTRFFLRHALTSPMLVAPESYREWEHTITLLVWRRASLRGVWLDAEGHAVAGRKLELLSGWVLPFGTEEQFAELSCTTNDRGEFDFAAVPANVRWKLHAAEDADRLVRLDADAFVLAPAEARELTLHSLPETTLRGIVRDAAGKPRRGAAVWLQDADGFLNVDSAPDGSFAFQRVSAGRYELKALYPPVYDGVREGLAIQLDVLGNEREQRADLQLQPTRSLTGRVLDAHRRIVDDAEIWYEPETMAYSGRVDAADDGSFELPQLFAGACRLRATGPHRCPLSPIRVVETGASGIELVLEPTGDLAGRVRAPALEDGDKIRIEAQLVTPRARNRDLDRGDGSFSVELEPGQETFAIGHVPSGRWLVQATAYDRIVSAQQLVTVDIDKTTTCADLVLSPSATLWCVARPGIGELEIEVRDEHDVVMRSRLADGVVAILHVPAGTLHVRASAPGVSFAEQHVVAPVNEQRLIGFGFDG
jgi:hypothetical protein